MCTIETSGERIRKLGKQQLVALIEPYASRLTEGYEAARLLKLYSQSLYRLDREAWQASSDMSANIYDKMNIIPRRAAIGIDI